MSGYYRTLIKQDIIESGLILNLDFNNIESYDGTSTVKNLASSVNNGSLINTPIFSNDAGGSIVLNGTSQYINCGNDLSLNVTNFTVGYWIKPTVLGVKALFVKNNNANNGAGYIEMYSINTSIRVTWNANLGQSIADIFIVNQWVKINAVYDGVNVKFYKNGILISSAPYTTSLNHTTGNLSIGAYGNGIAPTASSFGKAYLYNRGLTQDEITKNYEQTRIRYGI